jgi:hypothetical protein
MMETQISDSRLRRRGIRLGILSGAPAGAVSGFTAILFWGFWGLIPKITRGEPLAASDPVTLEQAVGNVIFNAVFFGIIAGLIFGATIGAVAGYFVRSKQATNPRMGIRTGMISFFLIGIFLRPLQWLEVVFFLVVSVLIGALGGYLGDRIFARLYRRGVGANLSPLDQE